MPKIVNGAETGLMTPDMVEAGKILNKLREFWVEEIKTTHLDQVVHSRLGVVAFTQWAAMLGVDVGMSPEQFQAVCNAQFKGAYDRAPKFS